MAGGQLTRTEWREMRRCVKQGVPHPDRAMWRRLIRWSDWVLSYRYLVRSVIVATGAAFLFAVVFQWIGKWASFTNCFVPVLIAQFGVPLSMAWNARKVRRIDRRQASASN